MPSSYTWPLSSPPSSSSSSDSSDGVATLLASTSGRERHGILLPFVRGASDFDTGSGAALINTSIRQILGTRCSSATTQGELPWRTDFGSLIPNARHRNNDVVLEALVNQWAVDALARWLSTVRVTRTVLTTKKDEHGNPTILFLRVYWEVIARGSSGSVLGSGSTSVRLGSIGRD